MYLKPQFRFYLPTQKHYTLGNNNLQTISCIQNCINYYTQNKRVKRVCNNIIIFYV